MGKKFGVEFQMDLTLLDLRAHKCLYPIRWHSDHSAFE